MDDDGHDADDEEGFDLDDVIGDPIDGWDDLVIANEASPDKAQDGQSEVTSDDYKPNDPWLEVVNSLVNDTQDDNPEEQQNLEADDDDH